MRFTKMNGAGNDFIIINNIEERVPGEELSALAKTVCDRHFSVGADGLMVVEKSEMPGADFRMVFFNSDGSLGEMCGNGARCIARYGFEEGLTGGREKVVIEAGAGKVSGERISEREYRVKLNDPSHIELSKTLAVRPGGEKEITVETSYILLGDPGLPHLVAEYKGELTDYCCSKSLREADIPRLREAGRALRCHEALTKGANVSFFETLSPGEVEAITYERGVEDFTLACGTGAGSVALALTLMGRVPSAVAHIHMPGGTLSVSIEQDAAKPFPGIMLTGPADKAAAGDIYI